ncbi:MULTISPECIES: tryptophanase [Methylosinus]|uniref:Tyrosine phenol-lyase n=1 Tax=Methylosinus trichosporium (strain ATCC 35070 / NCIMB 11131 / UNIQEM 75 / OB3b) TaxID=595536 RepID=A0A2D2CZ68_METT3|nr:MULTISPECIES: tryptophanase [Methylosinus]ATQ68038.1 tyrosine phenol-lyase [Methylosinus trichosporium OB3b]OBS53689.1 tyrosine phenol-lyase [Methylosinus sp. 3S-1]
MRTIIEPFRIKMTEALPMTTRARRAERLAAAHYNLFLLDADDVTIDLLTDSGTGAMSDRQWAAMMQGDESYAGSRSWRRFEATVRDITGFTHIFPTHQGRAAERILAATRLKPSDIVPNNSHFDTTRANIEYVGGRAIDLPSPKSRDIHSDERFKGDMDLGALARLIEREGARAIPFCMITATNNAGGGQPVSLRNMREAKALLAAHGIPLVLDACRFAENAYFIQQWEEGQAERPLLDIAREMFSLCDGATMSAKKDGLANIGGFLACNDDRWAEEFRNLLILTEGFPTYGGLAGRDLEAIAVGLMEALEEEYQRYRHATVDYLASRLIARGVPIVRPAGGHAVFLDAAGFCPHLSPADFPGVGLVDALYLEGGVRGVELGSVMFGRRETDGTETPAPRELVRLAFPRRVYTQSHFDYVIETIETVFADRAAIPPYRILWQAPFLRHFTARFAPG